MTMNRSTYSWDFTFSRLIRRRRLRLLYSGSHLKLSASSFGSLSRLYQTLKWYECRSHYLHTYFLDLTPTSLGAYIFFFPSDARTVSVMCYSCWWHRLFYLRAKTLCKVLVQSSVCWCTTALWGCCDHFWSWNSRGEWTIPISNTSGLSNFQGTPFTFVEFRAVSCRG